MEGEILLEVYLYLLTTFHPTWALGLLKLECSSEAPGKLVKTDNLAPLQRFWFTKALVVGAHEFAY